MLCMAGISDVQDESDRDGMRVVLDVKRGFNPEVCEACPEALPHPVRPQHPVSLCPSLPALLPHGVYMRCCFDCLEHPWVGMLGRPA